METAVCLKTNCDQIDQRFGELVIRPAQSARVRDRWELEVIREGKKLTYRENGLLRLCSTDASWLVYVVNCRINDLTLRSVPQRLLIHAGYASWRERSFLVAGDSGAGKTTLLCKLLLAGASVHCDETVGLDGLQVMPIPRKIHLKLTSMAQLPELQPLVRRARKYGELWDGTMTFDPTALGREWVVDPGGVDAVFVLEPNHQGDSSLSELSGSSLATALTQQITNYHSENRTEMKALIQLAASVKGYLLRIGNLNQAVRQIAAALEPGSPELEPNSLATQRVGSR